MFFLQLSTKPNKMQQMQKLFGAQPYLFIVSTKPYLFTRGFETTADFLLLLVSTKIRKTVSISYLLKPTGIQPSASIFRSRDILLLYRGSFHLSLHLFHSGIFSSFPQFHAGISYLAKLERSDVEAHTNSFVPSDVTQTRTQHVASDSSKLFLN